MVVVEYLGGVPGRPAGAPVAVTVRAGTLHLKQGGFLRGWSCRLPLATIAAAELLPARALEAGRLPSAGLARRVGVGDYLLAIEAPRPGDGAAIVLRGPMVALEALRQEILRGRMRAAKQWRS